jgi:uncharacterized damage-inducible protein DinB
MTMSATDVILHYLQSAREALVWKLDGLSEYDARRPLTPTGTNLLGLVKHVASVEAEYLGDCFGRPFGEPLPWLADDAEPNADMWATPEESRDDVLGLYDRARASSEATLHGLPLDTVGEIPWWPEDRRRVTLHQIAVHVVAETNRHAGHADVLREGIDGAAGLRNGNSNLPPVPAGWWEEHHARLEQVARQVDTSESATRSS